MEAPQPRASAGDIEAVARQLRNYLRSNSRDLEFEVDADTKALVITVRESGSGAVIRQIPNEEALQLQRHLQDLNERSGTLLHLTT